MRTFVSLVAIKMARVVFWLSCKMHRVLIAFAISRILSVFVLCPIEGWTFLEGLWWSGVTSESVGFGDYAPKTVIGRLVAEPFMLFWIYYILPVIGGHVIIYLFKNLHVFTDAEQNWLMKHIKITFDWVRWCVIALQAIAERQGVTLQEPPHKINGELVECEEEPDDVDFDAELVREAAQLRK